MKKSFEIIGFMCIMCYALMWTNILWNITGYKWMTMWYWIAWFGGQNV